MTVSCQRCGETWPRDPALEVECPRCHAPVGSPCKRPSEHTTWGGAPHASRDQLAMDRGLLKKCEGETRTPNIDRSND